MSDTPRTDAFDGCAVGLDLCPCAEVIKDHARQLERELAEARRDAERYRWLRDEAIHFVCHDGTDSPWVVLGKSAYECAPTCGGELDAAIDAAMKAE